MTLLLDVALPASGRVCRECGSAIVKKPGPGRFPAYCSDACRQAESLRRRVTREQRRQIAVTSDARTTCWICAKPMISHGAERPTCGACSQKYGRGVCSECGGPKRDVKPGKCRACIPVRPKAEPGICKLCEEPYVPRKAARPDQSFCSRSCKTAWQMGARPPFERRTVTGMALKVAQARTRRLRCAQTWDGITDEEILERDGWRCQIPGCKRRPIRKDLKYPHPRSKSIDHIIPLAHGGDDTAVNKRAAHLGCNVARGDKMGEEQVALFGVIREPPLVTRTAGGAKVLIPKPPKLCGVCSEPLVDGKCDLHLPVYWAKCDTCGKWLASQRQTVMRRKYCSKTCRPPMSAEARDRKRKRDRERRWVDPAYRERAIAATARWHDKRRASGMTRQEDGALF